jgi:hypothetical protein
VRDEVGIHRLCTLPRQLAIERSITGIVGVAADLEAQRRVGERDARGNHHEAALARLITKQLAPQQTGSSVAGMSSRTCRFWSCLATRHTAAGCQTCPEEKAEVGTT